MELMLKERERQRERVALCSTIRKTETDVSTHSCLSQHFEHAHTHSDSDEGLPPRIQRGCEGTHTLSFSLSIHLVSFLKTETKRNLRTDGQMYIQSAAGLTCGTKVLIASHLPVRGQTGAAEFEWEPAVGGSSQLHNTCLCNQIVCWRCSVLKYSPYALCQLYGWKL